MPIGGGSPNPIANVQDGSQLAGDATDLYWTMPSAGTVMKLAISAINSLQPSIFIGGQNHPTAIAVNSTHVFWTVQVAQKPPCTGACTTSTVVVSLPKSGQ